MMFTGSAVVALAVLALPFGVPVRGTIAGAGVRAYTVTIEAGLAVRGVLDQGDRDLIVQIHAPDGAAIATFDAAARGEEIVAFVAERGGPYTIAVSSAQKSSKPARFTLRLDAPNPRTDESDAIGTAAVLASEAKLLAGKGGHDELQQAVDRWLRARDIWRSRDLRSAELSSVVGTADALYGLSEYARAEPLYREALVMCAAQSDVRTCADVKNNLGLVCWRLGGIAEALALLKEAIDIWRSLGAADEASANNNRGLLLQQAGQYDEARRHFQRALVLIRAAGDRRGEAFVRNANGSALDQLGQSRAGLVELRRAVALFHQSGDRLAEGRALLSQSTIHLRLGDRPAALAATRQALDLIRAAGNRAAEADALLQLGRVIANDEAAMALTHYQSALQLYRDMGSRRGESDVLQAIGLVALASSEPVKAREAFERALAIRQEIGMPRLEADSMARVAQAEHAAGNLERAQSQFAKSFAVIEQLHAGLFERELRTAYLGSQRAFFGEYIDVLVALHRRRPEDGFAAQLFEVAEKQRARELIESMRTRWARTTEAAPKALRDRERELRTKINYWSWQLWQQAASPASRDRDAGTRGTIDALLADYAAVETEIARATPGVAALLRAEPVPLTTLQHDVLDRDSVLLQFVLGDARSYVCAITKDRIDIIDLPKRSTIEARAISFHRLFEGDPFDKERSVQRRRSAASLGRMLLAPVVEAIRSKRIVMVPDGALHYVPFAALIDPKSGQPLVYGHELVTVPSTTTLALVKRQAIGRSPAPKTLAVIADPVFDPADVRVSSKTAHASSPAPLTRRLSRLPYSREEADQILSLVPNGMKLRAVDFDANRALLTSAALKPFRIVHLAAHGIQDDEHPELSGVALSLVGRSGVAQDGFLRLQDIQDVALGADLVVLSACSTGRVSSKDGGEGLASLARGFFAANVPAVISSLFKADDEATADLMIRFYRAMLRDGQSPAAALRTAQVAISKGRFSDPVFWSGFMLQGTW